MLVRFEDVRDVGFFLFASGWFVIYFVNSGVITGRLIIILSADILITGLLAKKMTKEVRRVSRFGTAYQSAQPRLILLHQTDRQADSVTA